MSEPHCDWRVNVHNCQDENFFQIILFVGVALHVYIALASFGCVFARKYLLGQSWKTFLKGDDLSLLLFLLAAIVFMAQFLSVVLNAPAPIPGILWSFMYPIKQLPMIGFAHTLTGILPSTVFRQTPGKWYLNDHFRLNTLLAFYFYYLTAGVVIISLSQSFLSKGSLSVGAVLQQAGLLITALNNLFLTIGFFLICSAILKQLAEVISQTKGMKSGETTSSDQLLILVLEKLKQINMLIITSGPIDITYFILLASYSGFFSNLAFSKAMAVIMMVVYPSTAVLFSTQLLALDLKKWMYSRQIKTATSKKGDQSTSSSSHHRNSIIGKENVELVIDELRPRENAPEKS